VLTRLAEDDTQKGRGGTMRSRSTWVAWGLLALLVVGYAVEVFLSVANGNVERDPGDAVLLPLAFAAFLVVGCLIVARRPGNTVGWIFCAVGLLALAGALAEQYAQYAYVTRPGSLPGAVVAAWATAWMWYPTIALTLVFTPLLFPTGRTLSPRWRPVVWVAGGATAAFTVLGALRPSLELQDGRTVANPLAVGAVGNVEDSAVGVVLIGLILLSLAAAVGSLVIRFRRSRGDERQQLKWFTYACALLVILPLSDYLPLNIGNALYALVIVLPISVGVAILRYRLYDIDRLINRTLVYGLLTAILGLVYAAAVLVAGQVFGGVAGDPPSWAVAGATLAGVALFRPARRRTQDVVDRRFNRRRYDAAKTVAAFSARLRDEIDLDTLTEELLAVVDQTMEPTRVSLWLRPRAERLPR
jgi:hypothetical protein